MDDLVAHLEAKVKGRDNPRTYHGQRIRTHILSTEAQAALEYAATEPLHDTNHEQAVELLRRLANP